MVRGSQRGFTFIEMVVVLALIALVAVVSVRGLGNYFQQRKLHHYVKALYHDLKWARVEAILLNTAVSVTPSAGGWCQGWMLLQSANGHVLKEHREQADCSAEMKSFPQRTSFGFLPEGTSDYQNASFYFYHDGQLLNKIVVSQIGRVRFE